MEYSINANLKEMVEEIAGKSDRFLLVVTKSKSTSKDGPKYIYRQHEVKGNDSEQIQALLNVAKEGNVRIASQAIGTYTD